MLPEVTYFHQLVYSWIQLIERHIANPKIIIVGTDMEKCTPLHVIESIKDIQQKANNMKHWEGCKKTIQSNMEHFEWEAVCPIIARSENSISRMASASFTEYRILAIGQGKRYNNDRFLSMCKTSALANTKPFHLFEQALLFPKEY